MGFGIVFIVLGVPGVVVTQGWLSKSCNVNKIKFNAAKVVFAGDLNLNSQELFENRAETCFFT